MTDKSTPLGSDWPEHHPPGPVEHVYAIGVISMYYNDLEDTLLGLLKCYGEAPDALIALIFEKTPTNVRVQLLQKAMALKSVDADVRARIDHFLRAYGICTNNRGLLIHSRIWAHRLSDNTAIAAKRVRKSGEEWTYEFPLPLIRRVADEILFWERYGSYLLAYISRLERSKKKIPKGAQLLGPTTLPDTPPLPADLLQSFHDGRSTPPIPQFP